MAQLFLIIKVVMTALGMWSDFTLYVKNQEIADLAKKSEDLTIALNQAQQAQTDQEITDAQTRISGDVN